MKTLPFSFTAIILAVSSTAFSDTNDVARSIQQLQKNDARESERLEAITSIGKNDSLVAEDCLVNAALSDPSWKVRVASLRAAGSMQTRSARKLYIEQDKGVKGKKDVDKAVVKKRHEIMDKLAVLFDSNVAINCAYPNEVKSQAANFFCNSGREDIVLMLLDQLQRNTEMPFDERRKLERKARYSGHHLTSVLEHVIASQGEVGLPHIMNELSSATGDYRISLIIIQFNMSRDLIYDAEAQKYVPLFTFDTSLLKDCEAGLVESKCWGVKKQLAGLMKQSEYTPVSDEAKKIMKEMSSAERGPKT